MTIQVSKQVHISYCRTAMKRVADVPDLTLSTRRSCDYLTTHIEGKYGGEIACEVLLPLSIRSYIAQFMYLIVEAATLVLAHQ